MKTRLNTKHECVEVSEMLQLTMTSGGECELQ